jgi:dienelactone hydrolase
MPRQDVTIRTRDGQCPASVFTPAGASGPWPGVISFRDGLGIRPSIWETGQRLADAGYLVLLPDLYYRLGPYPPKYPMAVLVKTDPGALHGFAVRDMPVFDAAAAERHGTALLGLFRETIAVVG